MKTSSLLWSRLGCFSALASLLAGSNLLVPLIAAPLERPAAVTDNKPVTYDLEIVDGKLLRPSGKLDPTLANVVDVLREQYPDANISMSPRLSKLTVGDLKLRAGELRDELRALQVATGDRFELQSPADSNPQIINPTTGMPVANPRGSNAGLFILREAPPGPQARRVVEAFNIGPYLERLRQKAKEEGQPTRDVDDQGLLQIEKIITDTISSFREAGTDSGQPAFQFQYHPGATLLIVIGTVDSIEIARKIVNALPGMNSGPASVRTQTELQRSEAEAAFRARYGLAPGAAPGTQPEAAPPEATSKK